MKSERRHQLQQNELADALGEALGRFRPYAKPIAALLVVVALVVVVVSVIRYRATAHRALATHELFFITGEEDPEPYRNVGTEYADTAAGQWALLVHADLYLNRAIEAMYVDRDEAEGHLDAAIEGYRQVIERTEIPLARVRAEYGLAQAYESQGALDKAQEHYSYVAENADTEALADVASQRLARLSSEEMQRFYEWFASYDPGPAVGDDRAMPGDASLENLPDAPTTPLPDFSPAEPFGAEPTPAPLTPGAATEEAGTVPGEPMPAPVDADAPEGDEPMPEPDAPAEPETPAESDAPAESEAPAEPETPAEPDAPAEGDAPAESETPDAADAAAAGEAAEEEETAEEAPDEAPAADGEDDQ